jgi:hypothetical protein
MATPAQKAQFLPSSRSARVLALRCRAHVWLDLVPDDVAQKQAAYDQGAMVARMRQSGFTLAAIGDKLGLSRQQVRVIEAKYLCKFGYDNKPCPVEAHLSALPAAGYYYADGDKDKARYMIAALKALTGQPTTAEDFLAPNPVKPKRPPPPPPRPARMVTVEIGVESHDELGHRAVIKIDGYTKHATPWMADRDYANMYAERAKEYAYQLASGSDE